MKPNKPEKIWHSGWYRGSRILEWISDLVLIVVFLIGIYLAYDTVYVYHHTRVQSLQYHRPETIEELQGELLDEVVAWLTIDDTNIDYPIMQCDNNIKYLNLDAYGEYSLSGAIFMDFRCSPDFTDLYNLVYGHHMGAGMMFGALDEFYDEAYFNEHLTGSLLIDDKTVPLDIVAFLAIDVSEDEIFNPEPGNMDIYAYCDSHATYKRALDPSKHVLALSTCKEPMSTKRTVLICQYGL